MSTAARSERQSEHLPHWKLKTGGVIMPEERLPWGQTIVSRLQHGVAMAGGTIITPLVMGFDPNLALFFSGVGTLIFFLVVGGRVPSYLGFSFVAVVIAASAYSGHGPNPYLDVALGGIVAGGVLYGVIALIVIHSGVGWVERLMPPVVTGAVIGVIVAQLPRLGSSRPLRVDDAEYQLQMLGDRRSPASLQLLGHASPAQGAAGVRGLVPHALVRLLRPEDRLVVADSDAHLVADHLRFFAREGENVGQEGFDALVHRPSPQCRVLASPARFPRRSKPTSGRFWGARDEPTQAHRRRSRAASQAAMRRASSRVIR